MVSGYGVLCEVYEAGFGASTGAADQAAVTFKARATNRFRFIDMPELGLPMHAYAR